MIYEIKSRIWMLSHSRLSNPKMRQYHLSRWLFRCVLYLMLFEQSLRMIRKEALLIAEPRVFLSLLAARKYLTALDYFTPS